MSEVSQDGSGAQRGPIAEMWQLPTSLQTLVDEGCGDMIVELLAVFKADTASRVREIGRAVSTRDLALLRRLTHSLKGSTKQMGADEMASICERLEAVTEDELVSGVPNQIQNLSSAYLRVIGRMEAYE